MKTVESLSIWFVREHVAELVLHHFSGLGAGQGVDELQPDRQFER